MEYKVAMAQGMVMLFGESLTEERKGDEEDVQEEIKIVKGKRKKVKK